MLRRRVEEAVVRHEGWRSRPYLDTQGVPTFGYGFTNLSKTEGRLLVRYRLRTLERELTRRLPFWFTIPELSKEVLLEMAFQLGVSGLLHFSRTLYLLSQGEYFEAGEEVLRSKLARQTPSRVKYYSEKFKASDESAGSGQGEG